MHYDFLQRQEAGGDSIQIKGLAAENKDVSELMRRLNRSIWFGEPNLSKVSALGSAAPGRKALALADIRAFDLSVVLTKPKAEDAK